MACRRTGAGTSLDFVRFSSFCLISTRTTPIPSPLRSGQSSRLGAGLPCGGCRPWSRRCQPLLAHPLTEPGRLEIPPLAAAVVAMLVVASVARFWPARARRNGPMQRTRWRSIPGPVSLAPPDRWADGVRRPAAAGGDRRQGGHRQRGPEHRPRADPRGRLALLLAGSLLLGAIWRWIDPWDGIARVLDRRDEGEASFDVWWAVVPASLFAWYVGAYRDTYSPRSLGLALGLYTVVTVGGCLVVGRLRWLSAWRSSASCLPGRPSCDVAWPRGGPPRPAAKWSSASSRAGWCSAPSPSRACGGAWPCAGSLAYGTIGVAVFARWLRRAVVVVREDEWWRRRVWCRARGQCPGPGRPGPRAGHVRRSPVHQHLVPAHARSGSAGPRVGGVPCVGSPRTVSRRVSSSCGPLVAVQAFVVLAGSIAGAVLLARRVPVPADRQPGMAALCLIVAGGIVAITAS